MILILSEPEDEHANSVEAELARRGLPTARFCHTLVPTQSSLSAQYDARGLRAATLTWNGRNLEAGDVDVVWYRRPDEPALPPDALPPDEARLAREECKSLLLDFWTLFTCAWLPGTYYAQRFAGLKAQQLRAAGKLGFELPPTLVTNDPDRLIAFWEQHGGDIVGKTLGATLQQQFGPVGARYTEPVRRSDLTHVEALASCPMIFQGYVPKRVELRLTVVGDAVFAAEIHSQQTNQTRYDWRRYDFGQTPYLEHALPPSIAAKCVELVRHFGLRFGTIDMIVTPDGRYVFLELNPNGQYLFVEHETGLPITRSICDLLQAHVEER